MNIYFAGTMQSTFIQQDADLLSENHKLTIFDFSKHAASFSNIHKFLFYSACEWNNVRKSDVVVLWFADYTALPFIIWGKLFHKPIITHVGGWEVYSAPEIKYGNQLNPIRGWVTRWILRNSTMCVCMGEAYRNIIVTCEPKSKVFVIPGWVDDIDCDVSKLKKDDSIITALISIKFTEYLKGIPIFLEATKSLNARVIENVSHDELISILKKTCVYCQLSYTESFGMTLLEAMSCGCIPVVTDRDDLPEVVGDCGYVVPYGDVDATRKAILKAFKNRDVVKSINRAKMFSKENAKLLINSLLQEVCK